MALVATNIFTNPRGANTTGISFSGGTIAASTAVSGMGEDLTAIRWTRTTVGTLRLGFTGVASMFPANTERTVRATFQSSVTIPDVQVYHRPSATVTANQMLLGTITLPAGVPVSIFYKYTTSSIVPSSSTGVVLISAFPGTVGDTIDMTSMMVLSGLVDTPYFSGASPNTEYVTTAWTGTADASTSTRTLVDIAERSLLTPFGTSVASNSKAHMTVVYRGGWLG